MGPDFRRDDVERLYVCRPYPRLRAGMTNGRTNVPRTRLVVHIAEPFDFERRNGGVADLEGWTAQASPAFSDWVVHLDHVATIGDEDFDKIKISSRYAGETVSKVLEGFGFTAVNISYPRHEPDGRAYWHFGMVGNVLLAHDKG